MKSQRGPQKRHVLFILAILLLLLGGMGVFLGLHNFAIRAAGLVCIMLSVYVVRISNSPSLRTLGDATGQGTDASPANAITRRRPSRPIRTVGVVLLLLVGGSSLYLYLDARQGYHEVLPVYLFAAAALACALVWSYILASRLR